MSTEPVSQLLLHAVNQGDLPQCQMLIQEGGANVNFRNALGESGLHIAAYRGQVSVAELLLGFGADPNVQQLPRYGGRTPLHIAAVNNNLTLTTLLLQHDADPNIQDAFGKVALHDAAVHGHLGMVRLLLTGGAAPDVPDDVQFTPWHYAKQKNFIEIVKILPAKQDVSYAQRKEEAEKRLIWRQRKVAAPKRR